MSSGLIQDVEQFAARLKRQRSNELAHDPAGFRREAVRVLRASLSPGPGRPPSIEVTRAITERTKGTAWSDIYPLCIARFGDLSPYAQRVAKENLRAAVRARRNSQRRRNAPQNLPQTNRP
jgi:hypothetical protein